MERYDLNMLDAFSSDAIPMHLVTRQAFAGYLSRLTAHGVIVLHVSQSAHGAETSGGRGRRR
jgi:hypothetical protein